MKYSFHPEAEVEFSQAVAYYEERENSLGYDYAVEIYSAIERAVCHPRAWPIIEEGMRRVLVSRFPYGIIYSEATGELFIVAVMHLHRDPDYWKNR